MEHEQKLVNEIRASIDAIKKQFEELENKVGLAEEAGLEFDWEEGSLSSEVISGHLQLNSVKITVNL